MDVHVGKEHTDNFECGICNHKAQSKDDLEVHLFTCEMYKCGRCDYKENSISKIKKHTKKKHGIRTNKTLQHVKMDRNNPSEVSDKTYFFDEI